MRLVVAIQGNEVEASGNAIGHAHAAVATVHVDAVGPVAAGVGHEIDRFHHLARPAMLEALEAGETLARPRFDPGKALVHVVGSAAAMVFAADDQPVLSVARGLQADIMVWLERIPDQRVLDASSRYFAGHDVGAHR